MVNNQNSTNIIYRELCKHHHVLHDYHQLRKAYSLLKNNPPDWCSRYSLYHQLLEDKVWYRKHHKIKNIGKSIEPLSYLDLSRQLSPIISHQGNQKTLSAFSSASWPDFCRNLQGKVYISIGYRKAFYTHNPIAMHHGIVFVTDGKTRHAIYGFNTPKADEPCMNNDLYNVVAHKYIFYDELTICGDAKQFEKLFSIIEGYGKNMVYSLTKNNCYSAIIFGLLNVAQLGFSLPKDYDKRLLTILPKEQNYGLGTVNNIKLQPAIENMSARVLNGR